VTPKVRWLRVSAAAAAIVALSFVVVMAIIAAYAFVLAVQARGGPNQAVVNQFARVTASRVMPWLEGLLTFVLAWRMSRAADATRADGILIGVLSGLLSTAVVLAFGGHLVLRHLIVFLVITALGWLGGMAGRRWSAGLSPR
jgi:hypothetical protein